MTDGVVTFDVNMEVSSTVMTNSIQV